MTGSIRFLLALFSSDSYLEVQALQKCGSFDQYYILQRLTVLDRFSQWSNSQEENPTLEPCNDTIRLIRWESLSFLNCPDQVWGRRGIEPANSDLEYIGNYFISK